MNTVMRSRPNPGVLARADDFLGRFPKSVALLVLRLAVALPFWKSGLTKWEGWFQVSDGTKFLFQEEFRLHILGRQYPYPFPELAAHASAIGEIVLPILLVIGLGTRFAALGILLMTALIQLTVPDGWANFHLPWAAMALAVLTYGPGRLSVDHWLGRGNSSRA